LADKEDPDSKASAINPCPAFVIECFRRNVIIDLDRTYFDIIALHDFERHLSHKQRGLVKQIFSSADGENLHQITFNQVVYVVALRKNTRAFFKSLASRYTLHVVSYIARDLIL
jgi:hypothetical protein